MVMTNNLARSANPVVVATIPARCTPGPALVLVLVVIGAVSPAQADSKKPAQPAPRPAPARAAPAAMPRMGGGLARGGMSGGATMTGGGAGASTVHLPASMGGMRSGPSVGQPGMAVAHVPSSMIHQPSAMAAHIPAAAQTHPPMQQREATAHAPLSHPAAPARVPAPRVAALQPRSPVAAGQHGGGRTNDRRVATAEPGRHPEAEALHDHAGLHPVVDRADRPLEDRVIARPHTDLAHTDLARAERPHEARAFLQPDRQRDIAHDHAFVAEHAHDFHARYVRDFSPAELGHWRGGEWRNEWHYGRRGWWWQVGDVWYGYPAPVYPFPLEVAALATYDAPQVDGPDLSGYEMPPGASPGQMAGGLPNIAALPAPDPGSYRCDDPSGAWPDVSSCQQPWQLVAAASAGQP